MLTKNSELTYNIIQLNKQIQEQNKHIENKDKDETSKQEIDQLLNKNNELQTIINDITEKMQKNDDVDTPNNVVIGEYENKLEQQEKIFNLEKVELQNQISTINNKIKSLTDQVNNKDEILDL